MDLDGKAMGISAEILNGSCIIAGSRPSAKGRAADKDCISAGGNSGAGSISITGRG